MPNNRQWAILLWLGVLLGLALARRDLRSSVRGLVRTALHPVLLLPLAVMAAWVAGLSYAAAIVGLWDSDLATDTAFWFVFAGLILFGSFDEASKREDFFRRKALAVLEIGVAVEVFSELFVLSLFAEVFLVQPILALLAALSAAAALRAEHRNVKVVADSLVVAASVAILGYVAISLLHSWPAIDKGTLLREFALPVWLTVGSLPFVYALGLFEAYMSAFRRIDWRSRADRRAQANSKLALLVTFHVRAREVGKLSAPLEFRLASAHSFRQARRAIRESRRGSGPAPTRA